MGGGWARLPLMAHAVKIGAALSSSAPGTAWGPENTLSEAITITINTITISTIITINTISIMITIITITIITIINITIILLLLLLILSSAKTSCRCL